MELVESYINEVGRFLPQDQRDEVLAELRDDILGEIEGRAESSGHEPSSEDEQAVLAQFGHPLKVAGRYQPDKYIIGPDLYPAFMHTLKVLFGLVVFVQVIAGLIIAQTNGWQIGPFELFFHLLEMTVWVGAIVVLVFVGIEYSGERLHWYDNWQPRKLGSGSLGVIRRGDVITNLFSEGFFLLWWNDVIVLPLSKSIEGDEFSISLSPVWDDYGLFLNLIFGITFILHFYVLMRGVWGRGTLLAEIVSNTALLGIGFALISHSVLIDVEGGIEPFFGENIQRTARSVMGVICAVCVWDIWLALKSFRGTMSQLPPVVSIR